MKAAILAIGSELLGTDRIDTNSLRLTEVLESFGVVLVQKGVVGDDLEAIAEALARLAQSSDVVLITGGLGPTLDDLTRESVAAFAKRSLAMSEEVVASIEERYRSFGRVMSEVNRRQGRVIEGAVVLPNERGIAPGQRLSHDGTTFFLFPGVPRELEAMMVSSLEPWLLAQGVTGGFDQVEIRTACLAESRVEEMIAPAYEEFGADSVSVLAKPAEVRVRVRSVKGDRAQLAQRVERVSGLLGDAVYDVGGGVELEAAVGAALSKENQTLTTAESCTGGLVGARCTSVPGSSSWYLGGVVSYTNELKTQLLGVSNGLFVDHGAVSSPVAKEMALGAMSRLGSQWSISITGIAGPGGGSEEKPLGTVFIAVAGPTREQVVCRHFRFPGDRERVRRQASQFALELLRRRLLGQELPVGLPGTGEPGA